MPSNRFFLYGSLGLLILVLGIYGGLFYYQTRLSADSQDLDLQISQVGTPSQKQMESQVFDAKKKIGTFSDILGAHYKTSQVLSLLEKITHPKVWFTNFDLNAQGDNLTIYGATLNFQTLGQQVAILRGESMIREIKLSDLSIGDKGETDFKLELTLDPKVFQ